MKIRFLLIFVALIVIGIFIVPIDYKIDNAELSTTVFDKNGNLLRVYLNDNQQWCLPWKNNDDLPDKLKKTVVVYEDKRFYHHFGIDLLSLSRAIYQDIRYKKVVSGGSTITMQLTRILDPKRRTFISKLYEMFQTIKLEIFLTKDEIISLYLHRAPYGRNIVGVQTAARKYFGKSVLQLSWSEAAVLAVLPNSPGIISPGQNQKYLIKKRNRLLRKLLTKNVITKDVYDLAIKEPINASIYKFPQKAPHLCDRLKKTSSQKLIYSTIDYNLQSVIEKLAKQHSDYLKSFGINNLCVLVAETKTGKVRAYVGSQNYWDKDNQGQVDGILAPRSSGSILKPFLYGMSIDDGLITPESLVKDIPINIDTFSPLNADNSFSGLVRAKSALIRSLNVPAVYLLKNYGVLNFYTNLKRCGISTLFRPSDDYGLTLIIGGSEITLWDITALYKGLGNYGKFSSISIMEKQNQSKSTAVISPMSSYMILKIISNLKRPGNEYYWQLFEDSKPLSWKTGTSFGQRDAWAVGVNPQWTIGVWVGNFNGDGNPELGGAKSAGPLLFDIFNFLPDNGDDFFDMPIEKTKAITICKETGYKASEYCKHTKDILVSEKMKHLKICPYHTKIFVSDDEKYQVCSMCWGKHHKERIVLKYPPKITKFLRKNGKIIDYIPPHNPNCSSAWQEGDIKIIYPSNNTNIFLPLDIGRKLQKVVFEAAHRFVDTKIYWYLDDEYCGFTKEKHSLSLAPSAGEHTLKIVDENGKSDKIKFEIKKSKKK